MSRPRCMALSAKGHQCRNRAAHGSDFCGRHGPKVIGAPSKLTEPLILELANKARGGLYRNELALLAGVNPRTLYQWLQTGAADEEAGNTTTIHARFVQALRAAEAEAEDTMLEVIRLSAVGRRILAYDEEGEELDVNIAPDWRAAAFYLERRYPNKYGRRDKVTVDDGGKAAQPVEVRPASDEARAGIARILEAAGALTPPDERTP